MGEIHVFWQVYDNPIEGKLVYDNIQALTQHDPVYGSLWNWLQSTQMIDLLQKITGIPNLETDPHLHGAGLHYHPVNEFNHHYIKTLD